MEHMIYKKYLGKVYESSDFNGSGDDNVERMYSG